MDWRKEFLSLYRKAAECEPPPETQLDDVLVEFQNQYSIGINEIKKEQDS